MTFQSQRALSCRIYFKVAEYVGGRIADFVGITAPVYQYEIEEYYRMQEEVGFIVDPVLDMRENVIFSARREKDYALKKKSVGQDQRNMQWWRLISLFSLLCLTIGPS